MTSIIGWYYWSRGVFDLGPPIIERANSTDWKIVIACFLFFYLILHYFLDNFTDSNIVFFDSLTTSLAFVATLLMIRKRIENWVIWIIAVAIIIPICFYKQLYLTSIFYVFTLGLNITGLIKWNSILKAKEVRL